jgi:hypothetical protein
MLWRRDWPFCAGRVCAILPEYPGTAPLSAVTLHSENYRPTSMWGGRPMLPGRTGITGTRRKRKGMTNHLRAAMLFESNIYQ